MARPPSFTSALRPSTTFARAQRSHGRSSGPGAAARADCDAGAPLAPPARLISRRRRPVSPARAEHTRHTPCSPLAQALTLGGGASVAIGQPTQRFVTPLTAEAPSLRVELGAVTMRCRTNLKKEKRIRNRINAFRFKKSASRR